MSVVSDQSAPPRQESGHPLTALRANELMRTSTAVIVIGLALTHLMIGAQTDVDQALSRGALAVGVTLAIAFANELRGGLRNVIRADLFMLASLYLLTLAEFLFPQEELATRLSRDAIVLAIDLVLLGFGGIAVGRHVFEANRFAPRTGVVPPFEPREIFLVFMLCFALGYLSILSAVNFDILEAIRQMGQPRFTQPWARGRYGDAKALLSEVGALIFLIPPLAGAVLAQQRRYNLIQKAIVIAILGLTLYKGFAGGTRNEFLTYLVTLTASYLVLSPRRSWLAMISVAAATAAAASLAIYYMAELRTVGIANYSAAAERTKHVFVDMNIVNIAGLTEVFPHNEPFLGVEVPYIAAIRPIPRALWPGKPEGLSVSLEDALGARGLTLSATYVGEIWMAGGALAVLFASLCFGAIAGVWNRVGAQAKSSIEMILYTSGFFAAGICMRSFLSVAPTLLPTLALWLFLKLRARPSPPSRAT